MRAGQTRDGAAARLLLVDRNPASARQTKAQIGECFASLPEVVEARGGQAAAETLRAGGFDMVLVDLKSVGDFCPQAEEAVARLVRLAAGALVIVLSDGASVSAAVGAMRAGAHDFISRPVNGAAFAARIAELAERHGKTSLLRVGAPAVGITFSGFIGTSSQMQFVYEQIERIAPSAAPVFITGESGTGKEICAEALHRRGPRRDRRFVAINCAAIPRDLMESELFGAARGAFTGAIEERKGAVELADGGTLFLDEIGELDLSLQSKLLRFLQTGTLNRIGDATQRAVDVRVICATNRSPMQLIAERRFREDLFYRLHVLPIHLPPLRQRPADIVPLAHHFLGRYAAEEHKAFSGISQAAADLLVSREWPGNVRQLQNLMRRVVVMFDGGEASAEHIETADIETRGMACTKPQAQQPEVLPMWRHEQRIIAETIARYGGNIALAAAALEISPSTIYRKRQAWAEIEGRQGAA